MKNFQFVFILLSFLVSCQNHDFQEGTCWQKPDETVIFKITSLEKNKIIGQRFLSNTWDQQEDLSSISKNFIPTTCP